MQKGTLIWGIAGGSASGKSYLAAMLRQQLGPKTVQVIALDSYYRARSELSSEQRAQINYDHPEAFEVELLAAHIRSLKAGQNVKVPRYDFSKHDRKREEDEVAPVPLVLVEGILVLHFEELRSSFDHRIFLESPNELRLERRLARDVKERGRTTESVLDQWQRSVQPMYNEYCQPSKMFADQIIHHENFDSSLLELATRLKNLE